MRFGRTLELSRYAPWQDKYIDYAKLKKLLRDDESAETADKWTEEDESSFVDELVNVQLEKVHEFHKDTYERLREQTAKCEARLDDIAVREKGGLVESDGGSNGKGDGDANGNAKGKKPVPSDAETQKMLHEVLKALDQITRETNELEKYSRINYAGFLKATKKHDRKRGASYRVRPLLQVRLSSLPFNKEDYGPLLFRLSAMYSFVRQHLDGGAGNDAPATEKPPDMEEYTSHKFWVHPENLLEVKTMVLRHLPVLVFNPQTSKVAEGSQPDPSITSIYFDNPSFQLYSSKVEKSAGSSLRLRWYGQLNDRPKIWVEKKTVTEDDTSHEARFTIKAKYVQPFINGEYHMDKQIKKLEDLAGPENPEAKNMKAAVEDIQEFIKKYNLQPVVRANYTRTAFQIPGDDRVRISVDNDLAFIREDAIDSDRPCRDPESWHRTDIDNHEMEFPFSAIRKGEVNRFPFALLEIKLRNSNRNVEWIQDIMNSHLVKPAPRFSKFVHGVAELFEDHVNTFPFWLSAMEVDIRRDPQQAYEDEQAKKQKEMEDQFAVGSLLKSQPSMGSPRRSKPAGVLSPVGSPIVTGSLNRNSQKNSDMFTSTSKMGRVTADSTQQEDTVEEPDDDETGAQTHGTGRNSAPSGLKSLFPSFSTSKYAQSRRKTKLPPGVEEPKHWIKDQGTLKVEGKVWLANQRTFIKWQHVSVLLASLSLGLYNAAGPSNNVGRTLGIIYTVVAVFTGAWGYGVFIWRTRLIERRSGKDFDAVAGPVVVCIGLVVALLLNFAFKYHAIQQERQNDNKSVMMLNQSEYMLRYGEL